MNARRASELQRTIAEKVGCKGIGLHSGQTIEMSLHPARADAGTVFLRRDLHRPAEILARPSAVTSTSHATTISSTSGASVTTIEHLLSALFAHGIHNVRIELDGPEVPAMDGSAADFVELIRSAGLFPQAESQPSLRVCSPVEVVDGDRRIRIEPCETLSVQYLVEFDHPAIGRQELDLPEIDAEVFVRDLAQARTFGFLHEVGALLRAGLARGGSLENTVVLDDQGVLNTGGLRWHDEFVRHKIVDLLGDLALLGLPVQGRVTVQRGGHALHHMLARELLRQPDSWEIAGDPASLPRTFELATGSRSDS